MEELQLFNFEGNEVRTLKIDDEPYFIGKDVAEILGYAEPRRAVIQHVDKEDRKSLGRKDWGARIGAICVLTSGLIHMILLTKLLLMNQVFML